MEHVVSFIARALHLLAHFQRLLLSRLNKNKIGADSEIFLEQEQREKWEKYFRSIILKNVMLRTNRLLVHFFPFCHG